MTPETSWQITEIKHRKKHLPKATLQIGETGVTRVTPEEKKLDRILRRRKKTILLRITPETNIESDYPRIKIEDLVFDAKDQKQYQDIIEAATHIRRVDREHMQNLTHSARESIHEMLETRSEIITKLYNLEKEPRKTLYELNEPITIAGHQERFSEKIAQKNKNTVEKVDRLKPRLPEESIQKIYAGIYAIRQAQDAKFKQDNEQFSRAIALLEEATEKNMNPDRLCALTLPELTADLLEHLDNAMQNLIDSTEIGA